MSIPATASFFKCFDFDGYFNGFYKCIKKKDDQNSMGEKEWWRTNFAEIESIEWIFHTHTHTKPWPFEIEDEEENCLETSRSHPCLFSLFIHQNENSVSLRCQCVHVCVCVLCRIAYRVAFRIPIPFRSNSFRSFQFVTKSFFDTQFTWNSILMNQIKSNALATKT